MAKKKYFYSLFIEKYRPETIDNVLLPSKLKTLFLNFVADKEIPHLLFYSTKPGSGKTTVAKALATELKTDYLYINTSSENGIDALRNKIAKFATSYSMFADNIGAKKICILDEFDGSTPALQSALRAFMEEFQDCCRFILTCNYLSKIIEPLQSRCQLVDFNMTDEESTKEMKPQIIKRLEGILKHEKIEYDKTIIPRLVDSHYPDIRKMIGLLQKYSKQYNVIDANIFNYDKIDNELYDLILNKKLTLARKFIIEKNYAADDLYSDLFRNFVTLLPKEKQSQTILILCEYSYKSSFVIDKELCITACLLELISVL